VVERIRAAGHGRLVPAYLIATSVVSQQLTVSRVLSNALNESSNVIDDAAISAAAATASDKDLQFETMRLQAVFENVFDQGV